MGPEKSLFTMALGLEAPWYVDDVSFDPSSKQIGFEVTFRPGSRFPCPACGAVDQPVHDTRRRSWEHLRFFEHKAFLHAAIPRVACGQCGKTRQVTVPWARSGSGFTQRLKAFVIALVREMPVQAVADLLDVGDDRIWRVVTHCVDAARAEEDFSAVTAVGIDETAARRGHACITLVHDLRARRLLFACDGRDQDTVAKFVEDLAVHGGDADRITAACIDMSRAYIAGVGKHLPNAAITFDRFHVVKLANEALEQVRRAELRSEPVLKRSRWMWLKDKHRWTKTQIAQHHDLSRRKLKTARAFRLKEELRDIFATARNKAEAAELLTASLLGEAVPPRPVPQARRDDHDTVGRHPERLRQRADEGRRGGHQRLDPSRQGPRPWVSHHPQLHQRGLPRRRRFRQPAGVPLHHDISSCRDLTRSRTPHTIREEAFLPRVLLGRTA